MRRRRKCSYGKILVCLFAFVVVAGFAWSVTCPDPTRTISLPLQGPPKTNYFCVGAVPALSNLTCFIDYNQNYTGCPPDQISSATVSPPPPYDPGLYTITATGCNTSTQAVILVGNVEITGGEVNGVSTNFDGPVVTTCVSNMITFTANITPNQGRDQNNFHWEFPGRFGTDYIFGDGNGTGDGHSTYPTTRVMYLRPTNGTVNAFVQFPNAQNPHRSGYCGAKRNEGGNWVGDSFTLYAVAVTNVTAQGAVKIPYDSTVTGANPEILHFVTPKGGATDVATLTAAIVPNNADTRNAIVWDGATQDATDKLKATVPTGTASKKVVKIKFGNCPACVCREMRVWIVWASVTASASPVDKQRGLLDVGPPGPPHEMGFYANFPISFTHTISPATLFTDTDRPMLAGALDPATPVPGSTQIHPGTGLPLAGGATNKWDNSRKIRAKLINPASISTDHLISPPGLWTGYPGAYPTTPALGNDDSMTTDELDNNPYTDATLTGEDMPQLGVGDGGGSDGDTVEMRYHFLEFTRVQLSNVWYEVSDGFPWRFHFKTKKVSGHWIDNGSDGATDNNGY